MCAIRITRSPLNRPWPLRNRLIDQANLLSGVWDCRNCTSCKWYHCWSYQLEGFSGSPRVPYYFLDFTTPHGWHDWSGYQCANLFDFPGDQAIADCFQKTDNGLLQYVVFWRIRAHWFQYEAKIFTNFVRDSVHSSQVTQDSLSSLGHSFQNLQPQKTETPGHSFLIHDFRLPRSESMFSLQSAINWSNLLHHRSWKRPSNRYS